VTVALAGKHDRPKNNSNSLRISSPNLAILLEKLVKYYQVAVNAGSLFTFGTYYYSCRDSLMEILANGFSDQPLQTAAGDAERSGSK